MLYLCCSRVSQGRQTPGVLFDFEKGLTLTDFLISSDFIDFNNALLNDMKQSIGFVLLLQILELIGESLPSRKCVHNSKLFGEV